MHVVAVIVGVLFVLITLNDAFQTIILPKTVTRGLRLTDFFYTIVGKFYFGLVRHVRRKHLRQSLLVAYGPFSLLTLIGLWALLLMLGFAFVLWGSSLPFHDAMGGEETFPTYLYFSGVTFLTLGYGDVTAMTSTGRTLAVMEAGTGFGFLALVIGYIPVLYNAFSRREISIVLLDSKAGSNPTSCELLRRHSEAGCMEMVTPLLARFEEWSAQLLESYLSYPVLAFYRSQHDHQSWLCTITAILDTCALIDMGFAGPNTWDCQIQFQSKATFAMARHVIVDIAYLLDSAPIPDTSRLSEDRFQFIVHDLKQHGLYLDTSPEAVERFRRTRELYEPYVAGLADYLMLMLPEWAPTERVPDNWQTSAWDGGVKHF